jgi:UDP-N-acetylmuramoylalanine--D-glutamate ligase
LQKARTIKEIVIELRRKVKIEIKDKDVTVVGLARSGIGAANLLSELGANVTVTDIKTEEELKDFIPGLNHSVRLAFGGHPEDIFLLSDMIVVSPGVPLKIPLISNANSRGIPVIGELELAYQIVMGNELRVMSKNKNSKVNSSLITHHSSPFFLAVTGTNGKSTTTALLDFILRNSGFRTILGGNIGNALTEEIRKALSVRSKEKKENLSHALHFTPDSLAADYIVAEVSSFQLESIKDFRPRAATILNITPDHLDRYLSFEKYGLAKARIFENQGEGDFLVLNRDDPEAMKIAGEKLGERNKAPNIFYFSRNKEINGVYFKDGIIYCNLDYPSFPASPFPLITADEIKIKGVHNLENAMAASAMALLADCPAEAVKESLKEFPGLEHRLEFVREKNGVMYFNDSKGTNIGAVIKSLESFQKPIVMIAGGRDKAGDFSLLRHLVKERVKAIVLIGEAAEKIRKALGDLVETVMAKDLKEAVEMSRSMAIKGDVVLLSPACASFDMFVNFEDRGRQFKKIVAEME